MVGLLLGPARLLIGGVPRLDFPGRTAVYLLLMLLIAAGSAMANGHGLEVAVISGLFVITLVRVYGHGPMLRFPVSPDPDKKDFIFEASVNGMKYFSWLPMHLQEELQWQMYANLRYSLIAAIFDFVFTLRGLEDTKLTLATFAMVQMYRIGYAVHGVLPYGWIVKLGGVPKSNPLPDGYHDEEYVHYVELFGWALIGLALP